MELGWAESAPRLRSRLPNLNLLPGELLPTPLPWLTAGLVLLSLGLLMLLYALTYMRQYTDLEIDRLRGRLAEGQEVSRQLGLPIDGTSALPPGTLEDWAELRARQVDWAAVFGVVASGVGPGVQVAGLSQTGYTVSVAGEAASTQEANAFLQRLRDSGLFASLEMSLTSQPDVAAPPRPTAPAQPTVAATAAPAPSPPGPPTPPPAAGQVVPPLVTPPVGVIPTAPPKPPPLPSPTPVPPLPTLAPRTPLATPSPVGPPPTVAPTATSTPALDFIVQSKRETVDPAAIGNNASVRIRVIDAEGRLVPGLRARIESQGQPPWGTELPREGGSPSDGTFDFPVSMGKFTVFVLNGSSERATDLFTGVTGQPGVHVWDVTFRKTVGGTPPANPICVNCTPTPTHTPTSPTPTPISPGANLAGQACVTSSAAGHDAHKAVDGDVGTWWDSGVRPVQQITLDFTRYSNAHPRACQVKNQGEPLTVLVEGLELVPQMSGGSKATHEVATIYDSGSAQIEYTFADVDANDNVTLSARFAAIRTIQQIRIRTIRSNVNVGWREVRVFEPLPPPFGATLTPTVTHTPTTGATVMATPSPIASATVRAVSANASSEHPGNAATLAIDNNPNTFWRPAANIAQPYLQINFDGGQTLGGVRFTTAMGESIATATATVGPSTPTSTPVGASYRVLLIRPSLAAGQRAAQDNDCQAQFVAADNATIQFTCGPYSGVTAVRIYIESITNPALPPGIRDVVAYPPAAATETPTATPSPTSTVNGAATSTRTATPTSNATPAAGTQTAVPASSPTFTATPAPTQTFTQTATFTATAPPTSTPTRTSTPTDIT